MDELMQTSYAGRTTKVGDLVKGTVVKIARALRVNEQLVFRAIRARLERAD